MPASKIPEEAITDEKVPAEKVCAKESPRPAKYKCSRRDPWGEITFLWWLHLQSKTWSFLEDGNTGALQQTVGTQ